MRLWMICPFTVLAKTRNQKGKSPRCHQILHFHGGFSQYISEGIARRLGECRRKLRSALDLEHRVAFFIASAHYQIKSNEDMTAPGSDEFKRLEKLEIEGYESAKQIRKEILQEVGSLVRSRWTPCTDNVLGPHQSIKLHDKNPARRRIAVLRRNSGSRVLPFPRPPGQDRVGKARGARQHFERAG